jgi:hypothetical protein
LGPDRFWTKLVKERTMSKRRLSGFLIFALSLGCAFLPATAKAQEPFPAEGELEEGLRYVNTEKTIELVNTGEEVYVVMVTRRPGTPETERPVLYRAGTTAVPRKDLVSLRVFRLTLISEMVDAIWRPCMGADCSWQGPLPPPPPPLPDYLAAIFLAPQPQ